MKILRLIGSLAAVVCVCIATPAARGQRSNAEVSRAQTAVRKAMTGQIFHVTMLAGPGDEPERLPRFDLQMGAIGYPRYLRWISLQSVTFSDYTGRQAHDCAGRALQSELVLDYSKASKEEVARAGGPNHWIWEKWKDDGTGARILASARTREPFGEVLDPVFEMLVLSDGITLGPPTTIAGRPARALIKHHEMRPGDFTAIPIPPDVQDWLWIDVDSSLVLRWEVMRGGAPVSYGYVFTHNQAIEMKPPHSVVAPDCVS